MKSLTVGNNTAVRKSSFELLRHQEAVLSMPYGYPDIDYCFFSGGYGVGKSMTNVLHIFLLHNLYQGEFLTFGIGGAQIKHLKETVIKDVVQVLTMAKIPHKLNGQDGTLQIGSLTFVYFSLNQPENIFGHNFSVVMADEGGELSEKSRFRSAMTAIQERMRVPLPVTYKLREFCKKNGFPIPCYQGADGEWLPGRNPYVVSTTTSQGLDGVWLFMEHLKKSGVPFVRICAKTRDNKHIPYKQIQNLYKIYTEEEAAVYLEGEYRNLSSGRVYAEYDPNRHTYMKFDIRESDVIYTGQDFNAGYNANVACIVRGDTIFVIDEKHWNVVGDAPRLLREIYPNNKINLIPDASGKEIMSGWKTEFDHYKVDSIWHSTNPSISERILIINKLFRLGKLRIFENCHQTSNCLLMRGFDDSGKPQKEKGSGALDHWGDALEYAVWHITHTFNDFEELLSLLHLTPKIYETDVAGVEVEELF